MPKTTSASRRTAPEASIARWPRAERSGADEEGALTPAAGDAMELAIGGKEDEARACTAIPTVVSSACTGCRPVSLSRFRRCRSERISEACW